MKKRIGLFGGTFDPIHNGHLDVAKKARKQYFLHEVWFLVAPQSPFKVNSESALFKHRLEMVKRMLSPYRYFRASDIEQQLPVPSYSIDTIQYLRKMYPEYDFFWIMGSDQAQQFDQWKEPELIKSFVEVLVYPRRKSEIPLGFKSLSGDFVDVSSTEIREGTSRKTSKSVLRYMMEQSLYTEKILKGLVSEKRLRHIISMSVCAMEIAQSHHISMWEVQAAGMMHDYAKDMTSESDYQWLNTIAPKQASQAKSLWHATIASLVLSKKYYVKNRTIKRAIEGHVVGHSKTKLGRILYIADKCDPSRGLHRENLIEQAKTELNVVFKKVKKDAENYRKGRMDEK